MQVAVIGGGYAGMAAAVTLADAGAAVTVYEAGAQLGGRARRVEVEGTALDNGLHILLGAYRETLRLIERLTPSRDLLDRSRLDWRIHRRLTIRAAPLPAPLHLAAGILGACGAPFGERLAALRFMNAMRARGFRLDQDTSVRALLTAHRQGPSFVQHLWEPLCIAALNTPPESASARVFLNVLRDGLDAGRAASDVVLARVDLSALFPDPAARHVSARGGEVRMGCRVQTIEAEGKHVKVGTRGGVDRYDHVICAVAPQHAGALLSRLPALDEATALIERLRYQPIVSVYLQFAGNVRLPAPMLGFDGTAHWLFDRGAICGQEGLIGAVISTRTEVRQRPQDELARRVHDEIAGAFGPVPPLAWHRVIAEKQATFECAVDVRRPSTHTPLPNVHLAGDYTHGDYPGTLEAAVRSGIAAAGQVLDRPL